MTDSVDVLDVDKNTGDVETTVQSWLDNNAVTSVDDVETLDIGPNRAMVIILYTA